MDRLDAMRVFVRIVELSSFTAAARDLGLPASTVTDAVKQLEARLGVRLLERTTRHVGPTLDGEAYYRRCLAILGDVEEAESGFAGKKPSGLLRIDVQGGLARHFLMPNLPRFLADYPGIEIFMSEGDRFVDPVREGIDCVLRVGQSPDSDMIVRRVALLEETTCAAPDYLARHGVPKRWDALEGHRMVGFFSSATGRVLPLEFQVESALKTVMLPHTVSANGAQTYREAARRGLGLIQVPRYALGEDFAAGALVPVLDETPPSPSPVSLLYPRDRQLSARVRVFLDWAADQFAARRHEVDAAHTVKQAQ